MINYAVIALIFIGITPSLGFFSYPGIASLIAVLSILIHSIKSTQSIGFKISAGLKSLVSSENTLYTKYISLSILFIGAFHFGGLYESQYSWVIGQILFAISALYYVYTFILRKSYKKSYFVVSVLLYLCIAFFTVNTSQHPITDSFTQLQEAPMMILNGKNPYSEQFSKVYQHIEPNYFSLLPLSALLALPSVMFTNDPRYSMIIAQIITAILLYKLLSIGKKPELGYVFASTYLFFPRGMYIIDHAYSDSLVFLFLVLFTYCYLHKKELFSYLFLGMFFTIKQHILLLLPFWWTFGKNNLFAPSKKLALFILPFVLPLLFFLFDPRNFIYDTVDMLSTNKLSSPVSKALSLRTLAMQLNLVDMKSYIVVATIIIISFFIWIFMQKHISIILKMATALMVFHLFLHHSFFNHYYLIACMLLLEVVLHSSGEYKKLV